MLVLGLRIGGSGQAAANLRMEFDAGHIPQKRDGFSLYPGSINLVLGVGCFFQAPGEEPTTHHYRSHGETYFLQSIRLCPYDPKTDQEGEWFPGFIGRNRAHPPEFDNIVEIIAPEIPELRQGTKQWFKLDGPFKRVT